MRALVVLSMILTGSVSFADGFNCRSEAGDLNVKVYNHVQPTQGTRNAAVMVVSNPLASKGEKTIARFSDGNETLQNSAAIYSADVDLRFKGIQNKYALVGVTELREIKTMILSVDFSYAEPIPAGAETTGRLVLLKRDGTTTAEPLTCERKLK